jgi:hypothetical protein
MDELCALLRSMAVGEIEAQSSVKEKARTKILQMWKAVVSAKFETEIVEKARKVEALNLDLIRELGVLGLEMNASILGQVGVGFAKTGIQQTEVVSRLESLEVHSRSLLSAINHNNSELHQIKSMSTAGNEIGPAAVEMMARLSSGGSGIGRVSEPNKSIERSSTEIHEHIRAHNRFTEEQMKSLMQEKDTVTRVDLMEFRDELMGLLLGKRTTLSPKAMISSTELTGSDKSLMERHARRQLMRYPSRMKDSWTKLEQYHQRGLRPCHCRPTSERKHSRWHFGVSLRSESKFQHSLDRPYYHKGRKSWEYSIITQLHPLINKTMELTLGATSGAGGWSIASPLRFYGTVERCKSPIFQAFDDFLSSVLDSRYTPNPKPVFPFNL